MAVGVVSAAQPVCTVKHRLKASSQAAVEVHMRMRMAWHQWHWLGRAALNISGPLAALSAGLESTGGTPRWLRWHQATQQGPSTCG